MTEAPAGVAELFVREAGQGEPVLLLHGLGGDHTVWNGIVPLLSDHRRLIAPDLRGHGRSPTPDGSTFAFDELETDLLSLLDRRSIDRAHLVGMSAGGFLALRLALDRPDRVRSLALVGSAAQCDGHMRAVLQHWVDVYRDQGYEAYVLRLLKDLFYAEWLDNHLDYVDETMTKLRKVDLRGALQWGLAVRPFDVRQQLARLSVPTIAIHGMDDRVIDPSHARLLRQAIRGAEIRLLPYVGHMVPVERPEEMARLLAAFEGRPAVAAGGATP